MDLLAAVALVLVLEGLAVVMFAGSLPELMAALQSVTPGQRRTVGWIMIAAGAIGYLAIRG